MALVEIILHCVLYILQVSVQRGYNVILKDTNESGLGRGYEQVCKGYVLLLVCYNMPLRGI